MEKQTPVATTPEALLEEYARNYDENLRNDDDRETRRLLDEMGCCNRVSDGRAVSAVPVRGFKSLSPFDKRGWLDQHKRYVRADFERGKITADELEKRLSAMKALRPAPPVFGA